MAFSKKKTKTKTKQVQILSKLLSFSFSFSLSLSLSFSLSVTLKVSSWALLSSILSMWIWWNGSWYVTTTTTTECHKTKPQHHTHTIRCCKVSYRVVWQWTIVCCVSDKIGVFTTCSHNVFNVCTHDMEKKREPSSIVRMWRVCVCGGLSRCRFVFTPIFLYTHTFTLDHVPGWWWVCVLHSAPLSLQTHTEFSHQAVSQKLHVWKKKGLHWWSGTL